MTLAKVYWYAIQAIKDELVAEIDALAADLQSGKELDYEQIKELKEIVDEYMDARSSYGYHKKAESQQ